MTDCRLIVSVSNIYQLCNYLKQFILCFQKFQRVFFLIKFKIGLNAPRGPMQISAFTTRSYKALETCLGLIFSLRHPLHIFGLTIVNNYGLTCEKRAHRLELRYSFYQSILKEAEKLFTTMDDTLS